ncbi:MAG: hypothetical protein QOH66_1566 [Actinomycetota bacterium]|nr:hypothetical protein [Actinomycetota bacterium]
MKIGPDVGEIRVLTVIGTRPEAIKLAPVVLALERHPQFVSRVCITAQHRQLVDDVLSYFGVVPDHDLEIMTEGQSPSRVAAAVFRRLDLVFAHEAPHWVLVQGDTVSVMAAAVAGFYSRLRVAHVEAGLRSNDLEQPFPEEANRRLAAVVADLHLAPTNGARRNLLKEGVDDRDVEVTGNPGIDALHLALSAPYRSDALPDIPPSKRIILVTAHRRENLGEPLIAICEALLQISARHPDVQIVYPVHPNPAVHAVVHEMLAGSDVILLEPLRYRDLVELLGRSFLVLTDSGGLQEEAPTLGKPVLVLRNTTERPEAVAAGAAELVGRTQESIFAAVHKCLVDQAIFERMAKPRALFGDGQAAGRVVSALLSRSGRRSRIVPDLAPRPTPPVIPNDSASMEHLQAASVGAFATPVPDGSHLPINGS